MSGSPYKVNDQSSASDPLNTSYTIEGQEIHLQSGRSEVATIAGSVTKIKTFIFGKAVYGDLDGDGDDDAAVLLVHDPGGSGTFYYVAAALNLNGRYRGTNAVLFGENGKLTALNLLGEWDFNRSLGWEAEVGFGGSRSDSITSLVYRF